MHRSQLGVTDVSIYRSGTVDASYEPPMSPLAHTLPIPELAEPHRKKIALNRSNNYTVLYACQKLDESEMQKRKTLMIVDAQGLKPTAVTDETGEEENVLANDKVITKLLMTQERHGSLLVDAIEDPWQLGSVGEEKVMTLDASLERVLKRGPYRGLLSSQHYIELNDEVYNTPSMMIGESGGRCVFSALGFSPALLMNTIEVYGRTVFMDCHHERSQTKNKENNRKVDQMSVRLNRSFLLSGLDVLLLIQ